MQAAYPRCHRNPGAILALYNTGMPDPKANFQVVNATDNSIPTKTEQQKRDSLLRRRLIGAAIIISLALLGFAFPVVI
jgi:hypothetical protein